MKIDHIGYAVNDIASSLKKFLELGYILEKEVIDDTRNLQYAFVRNNEVVVELIQPWKKGLPTTIDNILKKGGAQPYHICYIVPSLDDAIFSLKKQGYIVVQPPEKAAAMGGAEVVFLYNIAVGLIELTA